MNLEICIIILCIVQLLFVDDDRHSFFHEHEFLQEQNLTAQLLPLSWMRVHQLFYLVSDQNLRLDKIEDVLVAAGSCYLATLFARMYQRRAQEFAAPQNNPLEDMRRGICPWSCVVRILWWLSTTRYISSRSGWEAKMVAVFDLALEHAMAMFLFLIARLSCDVLVDWRLVGHLAVRNMVQIFRW